MVFDWREYLQLSKFLQLQPQVGYTQESAFRCAVSRAYYAAFCHGRNYARDKQSYSPSYDFREHALVRKHFRQKGMVGVASMLDILRQWRNSCDYDDDVPALNSLLGSSISESEKILSQLS